MNAARGETAVSRIAAAIGERARSRMLYCLMDSHARTSTELAGIAGPDNPEATALDALDADEVRRRLVERLPADQADVVLLRVVGGLDVRRVAGVLGKRPGTVRVLQHRALRRLAKAFEARGVTK